MKIKLKNKKIIIYNLLVLLIVFIVFINFNKEYKEALVFKNENDTLKYVLLNGIYNEKYQNEYQDIIFKDQKNFGEVLTTFLPKGYSGKEINYLLSLSENNINILKRKTYVNLQNIYNYKNFSANNIERYNKYKNKTNYSYEKVITYVNNNVDYDYYENSSLIIDTENDLILVNKYNYLPNGYTPKDLDYVDGAYANKVPMKKVVKENFLLLQKYLKEKYNLELLPTTAYRNENFQTTLYNSYVSKYGKENADKFSARPGYSEHQTALAIDLKNIAIKSDTRLNENDFNILNDNAYKYGFIIRYPKGKEEITGYDFENWHIRYVGKDNAKIIHDNSLTLEEYIDLYIKNY